MATKFMAGKRIIGNKSDRDGLTDFNDTLESSADGSNSGITLKLGGETLKGTPDSTSLVSNTTGWTLQSGSGSYLSLDSTNNELDITMGENADHCAYFDLGSGSVSDTKWTLRFKYQIRTYTASSSGQFAIGLSSSTNSLISNNQNFIIFSNTVTSSLNRWRGHGDVNDKQSAGQGASLLTGTMGTSSGVSTKYYEIAKLSTGHIRCRIYNDSSYTTLDSEAEDTSSDADGDPTGLRYIQFALYDEGTVPTYTASLSNVEFYNNSANLSDSKLGSGAYSFDGSNDRVTTDQRVNGLHDGTGGSVALWVKPTSSADNDIIFNTHNGSGSGVGVEIKFDSSNRIKVASTNSSNGWVTANSTTALSNGTWYHVAVTLDTDTKYRIYINGTLEATSSAFTPKTANSTNPYYLGDSPDSGNYYDGVLDDVGIYSRVLSATEIGKLANNNSPSPNITDSPAYTKVGTTVSASGTTIEATNAQTNQNPVHRVYKDIGSVSDSTFYFEFDYKQKQNTMNLYPIALQSGTGKTNIASEDMIYLKTNGLDLTIAKKNGGSNTNSGDGWITIVANTQYYCSITRSSNTASLKVYSDSSRSTQVGGTKTVSVSDVSGLQYLHSESRGDGGGGTNMGWVLDNISLTNGATTKGSAGAAQSVSSLSNKAGLKAHYTMDSTNVTDASPTDTTIFSTGTGWSGDTSTWAYNSTINGIGCDTSTVGEGVVKDLGAQLSNSGKWLVRFKLTRNSGDQADGAFLAFGTKVLAQLNPTTVSYTHLTLPTNREV